MVGRRLNAFALARLLLVAAVLASLSAQPATAWTIAHSKTCTSADGACESESQRSPQVNACAFGKGVYLMADFSSGANVQWGPNDDCADPSQQNRVSAGVCSGFDDDSDILFDFDNSDGRITVYFLFVGKSSSGGDGVGTQSAGTCS